MVEEPVPPQICMEGLSDLLGIYRHEMTEFEAKSWRAIMCAVPQERFLAYLQNHIFTGSPFAPKPSDATRALELALDADGAYARVGRLVKEVGPYQVPTIEDPVLVTAILYMGGWAKINEELPDPANNFAVKNFRDRFDACFTQAMNAVRIRKELPDRPLISLSTPRAQPAPALQHQAAPRLPQPEAEPPATVSRHLRFGRTPT